LFTAELDKMAQTGGEAICATTAIDSRGEIITTDATAVL
jgi:hypothetical protein